MSVLGYWGQGIKRFSLELQTIHQFSQSRRRHYAKQLWFSFVPALSAVYPIIYSGACPACPLIACFAAPLPNISRLGWGTHEDTQGRSSYHCTGQFINFCPPQHLCRSIFLSFNANNCTMHYATTVCYSRLCMYGGVMTWLIKKSGEECFPIILSVCISWTLSISLSIFVEWQHQKYLRTAPEAKWNICTISSRDELSNVGWRLRDSSE